MNCCCSGLGWGLRRRTYGILEYLIRSVLEKGRELETLSRFVGFVDLFELFELFEGSGVLLTLIVDHP
jgi:hypothetical protein